MNFVGLVNADVACTAKGCHGLQCASRGLERAMFYGGCRVGNPAISINAVPEMRPSGEIRADG